MSEINSKKNFGSAGKLWWVLAGFLLLTACAPMTSAPSRLRYVWPPVADAARIEYVGFYAGDGDLRQSKESWLEKYIFGQKLSHAVFKKPFAVDARFGKVVVSDTIARQIVLFDLARETIEPISFADSEANQEKAVFGTVTGIALAGPGEFWMAVAQSKEVFHCSIDGQILNKVGAGTMTRPVALAIDHKNRRVVVVDAPAHRLAVFSLDGIFLGYLGERGTAPGQFNYPLDADFDGDGDLYVLDALNARVQRFHWDGAAYRYQMQFGEHGTAAGSFQMPKSLAVSPSGHVYVTDSLADKVTVFDRDGTFLLTFGGRFVVSGGQVAPGGFNMPAGIAADENDGIWITDTLNGMVHQFQYLNEAYLRDHPIAPDQVLQLSQEIWPDKSNAAVKAEGGK